MKALIVTAPDTLRTTLRGLGDRELIAHCATRCPDRATAGDPVGVDVVNALDGRSVAVADADRSTYHAAAAVAANHLVALLGQVDRLAGSIGVPLEAYLDLARGALADVAEVGPVDALTGPVARGDRDTVARHLAALPEEERTIYAVLAGAAERLVDQRGAVPA